MKEGGRNIRRVGIVGTIGMAAVVAACGSTTEKDPKQNPDSYRYRLSYQAANGTRLNCHLNSYEPDPKKENIIYVIDALCPDREKNQKIWGTSETVFPVLELDLARTRLAILIDKHMYSNDGATIPPIFEGENLLPDE